MSLEYVCVERFFFFFFKWCCLPGKVECEWKLHMSCLLLELHSLLHSNAVDGMNADECAAVRGCGKLKWWEAVTFSHEEGEATQICLYVLLHCANWNMKIYKKVARLRAQTSTPNKSTDPGGICQTRDFKVLSSGLKNILKKKKDMISPKYLALPLVSTAWLRLGEDYGYDMVR